MSEHEAIAAHPDEPVTVPRIRDDLLSLGVEPGMTVLVHSSLSRIGWVCGGALAVVLALESAVEEFGTILMPTHSGDLSDPAGWENPPVPISWLDTIRATMPAYDPAATPSRGIGVVPEIFRTQPETLRSSHPAVSFAAWGEQALELVGEHPLTNSLGEESPLGALYRLDGWVLMIGTGFDTNTSFHLAEYRSNFPTKESRVLGAPVLVDGHRRWVRYDDISYDSSDFADLGEAFFRRFRHEIRNGTIGHADSFLFPQRLCVDFAVTWLEEHRR